jgi:DNA polymerase elongation subunit (family B)
MDINSICYYDLETTSLSSETGRIISCSILDDNETKPKFFLIDDLNDDSERKLIQDIYDYLSNFDLVCGFNNMIFDTPFMFQRAKILDLTLDKNVYSYNKRFEYSSSKIFISSDYEEFDFLAFIRKRGMKEYSSYSLDNIAYEELGENKVQINQLPGEIYNDGDYALLEEYNDKDVILLQKLNNKLHLIDLVLTLCNLTYSKPYQTYGTVNMLNTLFMNLFPDLSKPNAPNRLPSDILNNYGGFNLETTNQIFIDNIYDIDLASLYPSIMIEFKKYLNPDFGNWLSNNIDERNKAKLVGDDTRQYALKILNNSAYGYLSNSFSAFYHPEYSSFITLTGRLIIKMTIHILNDYLDCESIFTSTDSVFFLKNSNTNTKTIDDILSIIHDYVDDFVNFIKYSLDETNDLFLGISPGIYHDKKSVFKWEEEFIVKFLNNHKFNNKSPDSRIRFEHEATFSHLMLTDAIKNYAYVIDGNLDDIKYVGGVSIRSTANQITKDIYNYFMKEVLSGRSDFSDYKSIIENKLLNGKVFDYSFRYRISKDYFNFIKEGRNSYKANGVKNSVECFDIKVDEGNIYYLLEFNKIMFPKCRDKFIFAFSKDDLDLNSFNIDVKDIDLSRIRKDVTKIVLDLLQKFDLKTEKGVQKSLFDF